MEASPPLGCQDDDGIESGTDDPVEECSEDEAPPPLPEPKTPLGAAGRFASLLGVQRSANRPTSESIPADDDDIVGATQHAAPEAGNAASSLLLNAELDGSAPTQPGVACSGVGLTQGLEDVIGNARCLATNLDGLLAAADDGEPKGGTGHDIAEEDTLPASPETLLRAARVQDDGTMAVGGLESFFGEGDAINDGLGSRHDPAEPFMCEELRDPDAAADSSTATGKAMPSKHAMATGEASAFVDAHGDSGAAPAPEVERTELQAEDSEASDADIAGNDGLNVGSRFAALASSWQEPLPDEPWMSRPAHERELWERVRPRALRREAAQLRALRLPAAAMSRLMRLHPAMQVRSTEALELINYSTLLLLQAVTRAAVRGKAAGQRIQFEDVRQACSGMRELQFLHPLSCTLDASAHLIRKSAVASGADAEHTADRGTRTSSDGNQTSERAGATGIAALLLTAGQYGRNPSIPAPEAAPEGQADAATSKGAEQINGETKGAKRRMPASAQRSASKAPRQAGAAAAGAGPTLANFFKRADAAK